MRYFLFIALLTVFESTPARSQTPDVHHTIQGVVLDSVTLSAVPSVTIALYRDKQLTGGAVTDSSGRFVLNVQQPGNYSIRISHMGYQPWQSATFLVNAQKPTIDLGSLPLRPRVASLPAISISGKKPLIEQRAGGFVFNAESLPALTGPEAADLLRMIPLLSVDPNGALSIRGSANIKVFIDGQPSETYAPSVGEALKTIRSRNILKVEVITHPSAKYDAEGTDGVVNIITRKAGIRKVNGNISATLGNRSQNLMGDISGQTGQWSFNADALYQKYRNRNGSELEREAGERRFVQKNESRQTGDYYTGGAHVLYNPDSLNTLTMGYRVRHAFHSTRNVSKNYHAEGGLTVPSFQRNTLAPDGDNEHTFSAAYNGKSQNGHRELSLQAQYFLFKGTGGYDLDQLPDGNTDHKENFRSARRDHDYTVRGDYTQSFTERFKWEAGAKLSRKSVRSNSRFGIYDLPKKKYLDDSVRSGPFNYQSSVYALYNSISMKWRKWMIQAGVRYEQTRLKAAFKDTSLRIPSYDNVVPDLLITRELDENTFLKISYAMKLDRPYISYLDPVVDRSDSLTSQAGNPYLKPEITRRYEASYTRNAPKLYTDLSVFFNDNRNSIENIRRPLPGGLFESSWQNTGRDRRLGMSASFTWKPTADLNLSATFTGQYVWLKSPALGIAHSGLMRELVANGSYRFPKGFSISFYGFFNARNLRLQGYRSGWKYYSMTLGKKSKNEKLEVSLKMDAFLTPYSYIKEEVSAASFYQKQTFRYQNQNFRLSFSVKLGKADNNNRQIPPTGEED